MSRNQGQSGKPPTRPPAQGQPPPKLGDVYKCRICDGELQCTADSNRPADADFKVPRCHGWDMQLEGV